MRDPSAEYEQFLREYIAFVRARNKRQRSRFQPLIWFERLFNQVLKAFLAVADSFTTAIIR